MRAIMNPITLAATIGAVVVCIPTGVCHAQNNAVTVEGVSDYSYYRSVYGGNASNIDMAAEVSGFYNTMTVSGSPWIGGPMWTDSAVYDSDFYDPDVIANGNDTNGFDSTQYTGTGTAFAFVGAHGRCDDDTSQLCSANSDCPSGSWCPSSPPSTGTSKCINGSARSVITSSPSSVFGQYVYYGNGGVRWGEDSSSGGWAGAGTNGSNAVVFVANSCGSKYPFMVAETFYAFAGAMLMNFTMPQSNMTTGFADLIAWSDRGTVLATYALANPNSSITGGWAANLDSASLYSGGSCPDISGGYTYGGGHGYQGCAANVSIANADTVSGPNWALSMTWLDASNFTKKPHNANFGSESMHCNYDCATYGFVK